MDLWNALYLRLVERVGSRGGALAVLGCVVALVMVLAYLWALEQRERAREGRRLHRWNRDG